MSNKDCYNRLLQQSVRKESAIRYVLNVHNYKRLHVASCNITNTESLDHPSQTAVDIISFWLKKYNNCDKVLIWKPIYHTRMHTEENPNKSQQCGKVLI